MPLCREVFPFQVLLFPRLLSLSVLCLHNLKPFLTKHFQPEYLLPLYLFLGCHLCHHTSSSILQEFFLIFPYCEQFVHLLNHLSPNLQEAIALLVLTTSHIYLLPQLNHHLLSFYNKKENTFIGCSLYIIQCLNFHTSIILQYNRTLQGHFRTFLKIFF